MTCIRHIVYLLMRPKFLLHCHDENGVYLLYIRITLHVIYRFFVTVSRGPLLILSHVNILSDCSKPYVNLHIVSYKTCCTVAFTVGASLSTLLLYFSRHVHNKCHKLFDVLNIIIWWLQFSIMFNLYPMSIFTCTLNHSLCLLKYMPCLFIHNVPIWNAVKLCIMSTTLSRSVCMVNDLGLPFFLSAAFRMCDPRLICFIVIHFRHDRGSGEACASRDVQGKWITTLRWFLFLLSFWI